MNNSNKVKEKMELLKDQKYLGKTGLVCFISLMVMFIPLSMDLYLPALPIMTEYFNTTSALTGATLTAFFIFYAVGIIFFGPLSDKMGRKPILILGIILYLAGSVFCTVSMSIYQLIAARIIQAFGAGSITAIGTALVKDCFSGNARDKVLAVVQAMSVIAPMIAPIAGAAILQFFGWRETFLVLTGIGVITLIISFFYQETLPEQERYKGNLTGTLLRLFAVGRNKGFISFLFLMSVLSAPYMAYISMSSFIYVDYFNLSSQTYSYFFAANSAVSVVGPYIYVRTVGKVQPRKFAHFCFGLALLSGLSTLILGKFSPFIFLMSFALFTLVVGALRPFSTSILLEQQKSDTGSASSLINSIQTFVGSIGMILGSLQWYNIVDGLGIIITGSSVIAIVSWIILMRGKIHVKGL